MKTSLRGNMTNYLHSLRFPKLPTKGMLPLLTDLHYIYDYTDYIIRHRIIVTLRYTRPAGAGYLNA